MGADGLDGVYGKTRNVRNAGGELVHGGACEPTADIVMGQPYDQSITSWRCGSEVAFTAAQLREDKRTIKKPTNHDVLFSRTFLGQSCASPPTALSSSEASQQAAINEGSATEWIGQLPQGRDGMVRVRIHA